MTIGELVMKYNLLKSCPYVSGADNIGRTNKYQTLAEPRNDGVYAI
jgi:hypothetical protein